jgi:hypothetical protein
MPYEEYIGVPSPPTIHDEVLSYHFKLSHPPYALLEYCQSPLHSHTDSYHSFTKLSKYLEEQMSKLEERMGDTEEPGGNEDTKDSEHVGDNEGAVDPSELYD